MTFKLQVFPRKIPLSWYRGTCRPPPPPALLHTWIWIEGAQRKLHIFFSRLKFLFIFIVIIIILNSITTIMTDGLRDMILFDTHVKPGHFHIDLHMENWLPNLRPTDWKWTIPLIIMPTHYAADTWTMSNQRTLWWDLCFAFWFLSYRSKYNYITILSTIFYFRSKDYSPWLPSRWTHIKVFLVKRTSDINYRNMLQKLVLHSLSYTHLNNSYEQEPNGLEKVKFVSTELCRILPYLQKGICEHFAIIYGSTDCFVIESTDDRHVEPDESGDECSHGDNPGPALGTSCDTSSASEQSVCIWCGVAGEFERPLCENCVAIPNRINAMKIDFTISNANKASSEMKSRAISKQWKCQPPIILTQKEISPTTPPKLTRKLPK